MICDTSVQELKYKALKEIATLEYEGRLAEGLLGAAERLVPGPKPSMRCANSPCMIDENGGKTFFR